MPYWLPESVGSLKQHYCQLCAAQFILETPNDGDLYENFLLPPTYWHKQTLNRFGILLIFKKPPIANILDAFSPAAKNYSSPLATSSTELGLSSREFKRH